MFFDAEKDRPETYLFSSNDMFCPLLQPSPPDILTCCLTPFSDNNRLRDLYIHVLMVKKEGVKYGEVLNATQVPWLVMNERTHKTLMQASKNQGIVQGCSTSANPPKYQARHAPASNLIELLGSDLLIMILGILWRTSKDPLKSRTNLKSICKRFEEIIIENSTVTGDKYYEKVPVGNEEKTLCVEVVTLTMLTEQITTIQTSKPKKNPRSSNKTTDVLKSNSNNKSQSIRVIGAVNPMVMAKWLRDLSLISLEIQLTQEKTQNATAYMALANCISNMPLLEDLSISLDKIAVRMGLEGLITKLQLPGSCGKLSVRIASGPTTEALTPTELNMLVGKGLKELELPCSMFLQLLPAGEKPSTDPKRQKEQMKEAMMNFAPNLEGLDTLRLTLRQPEQKSIAQDETQIDMYIRLQEV